MTTPIVMKVGGAEGNAIEGLVADVARLRAAGRAVVIVHGGSGETDALAERLGHPPRFLESPSGQRSRDTDRTTLETFAMATALVNRRLVEALRGAGVDAIGMSGLDAGLVTGRRKAQTRAVRDGRTVVVRDQWTGRPAAVRAALLESLLSAGLVPVIAPVIGSEVGEMLNVDGDRLAALVASSLEASDLLLLTNVHGILRDLTDPRSLIERLTPDELERLGPVVQGRMKKKVMGAVEALSAGVGRVVIATSQGETPVDHALRGHGTVIVSGTADLEEAAS